MGNRTFIMQPHPECMKLLDSISEKYGDTLSATLSRAIGILDLITQYPGGTVIIRDKSGDEVIEMDGF